MNAAPKQEVFRLPPQDEEVFIGSVVRQRQSSFQKTTETTQNKNDKSYRSRFSPLGAFFSEDMIESGLNNNHYVRVMEQGKNGSFDLKKSDDTNDGGNNNANVEVIPIQWESDGKNLLEACAAPRLPCFLLGFSLLQQGLFRNVSTYDTVKNENDANYNELQSINAFKPICEALSWCSPKKNVENWFSYCCRLWTFKAFRRTLCASICNFINLLYPHVGLEAFSFIFTLGAVAASVEQNAAFDQRVIKLLIDVQNRLDIDTTETEQMLVQYELDNNN